MGNADIDQQAAQFAAELNAFKKIIEQDSNVDNLGRILVAELNKFLKEGAKKYLDDNGLFKFEDSMELVKDSSGVINVATYTAYHEGRELFLKKLPSKFGSGFHLKEIQNARLLELLGLSPKVEIVMQGGDSYLVMEKVPGINIKEVIAPATRTSASSVRIESQLGADLGSISEAARIFSRIIISNPGYEVRLREIAKILRRAGFTSTRDFQFMIDLAKGPSSIMVIDSPLFKRNETGDLAGPTPEESVTKTMRLLKRFSH